MYATSPIPFQPFCNFESINPFYELLLHLNEYTSSALAHALPTSVEHCLKTELCSNLTLPNALPQNDYLIIKQLYATYAMTL